MAEEYVLRRCGEIAGYLPDTRSNDTRWLINTLRDEWRARDLLAALTADEWAGWGWDDDEDGYQCCYCHYYTTEHDGGYQHKPDCPLTRARVLLGTQPQPEEAE
ncbi:MAG: hypothetical protein ACTHMU_03670 [Thermomicrobiales bacterium]